MAKLHPIAMLTACVCFSVSLTAQDNPSLSDKVLSFPSRFLNKVNKKSSHLEDQIINKSERALKQLAKEERRLQKKLYRKDSALAKQVFGQAEFEYLSLQSELKKKSDQINGHSAYIPFLDTLTTSIRFLEKNDFTAYKHQIKQTIATVEGMGSRLHQAEQIQHYLKNRRQYLKDQLGKLNMTKELRSYSKEIWYYEAQINEYKNILKQPEKLERKTIDLLLKTKPFKEFLQKNSVLGSLFQPSGSPVLTGNQPVIPGAQTTAQVNNVMQQSLAGPNSSMQVLQANIQQAQGQIQQLKNRINEAGGSSDDELRDFKPNMQKVKSFWNRFEIGTNLQSTKGNQWLPTATQLGLSAGYKLNDRSIVGIGMAGSIGWGKDIRHINMSYEGASARSYLDWKIKGTFWVSAGYELNYKQQISRIEELKAFTAWQQSGLIGISKKYNISKKIKGKMSLLWDYLSYQQLPRTQPLIFRFGYSIK